MNNLKIFVLAAAFAFCGSSSAYAWGSVDAWAARKDAGLCMRDDGCNGRDGTPPKWGYRGGPAYGPGRGFGPGFVGGMYYVPPAAMPPQQDPMQIMMMQRRLENFMTCGAMMNRSALNWIQDGRIIVRAAIMNGIPCYQLYQRGVFVVVNPEASLRIKGGIFDSDDPAVNEAAYRELMIIAVEQHVLPPSVIPPPVDFSNE